MRTPDAWDHLAEVSTSSGSAPRAVFRSRDPEEIPASLVHLVGDAASISTGVVLVTDDGYSLL